MNRAFKIYIAFFVLIIVGIIALDLSRPKPIDWSPTYATKDKIPLGLYVLDKEINGLFPGQKVERFGNTVYEYLNPKYSYADSAYTAKGSVLMIAEDNDIDPSSLEELLKFVESGNSAFLSMRSFPEGLTDTLKIDYNGMYVASDSLSFSLSNPVFKGKNYKFTKGLSPVYFSEIDTASTTVLGYQEGDSIRNANFIKVPFKKGNFYLHTQPTVFSNYNLLRKDNAQYCASILSYLPAGNIYWQAKSFRNDQMSSSPMRYILSQPALKWAWYLFLIGMLVFMVFNAKRKQRIIPIKVPLSNTTVDFTKTIGNLYLQEGDHHDIIGKKIIYFLEKIRTDYLMETFSFDETFVNRLHQKSGRKKEEIELIIKLIRRHRSHYMSTEKDVIEISKAFEAFSNGKILNIKNTVEAKTLHLQQS